MRVLLYPLTLALCGLLLGSSCGAPPAVPTLSGDANRGAVLFATSDGIGPACQNCHCPDASGGCRLSAPGLRGVSYVEVNARTRGTVEHPGGKFDFSDQDLADLVAHLEALNNASP